MTRPVMNYFDIENTTLDEILLQFNVSKFIKDSEILLNDIDLSDEMFSYNANNLVKYYELYVEKILKEYEENEYSSIKKLYSYLKSKS